MGASVERALERLGIATERAGRRLWAEQCPLPTHGAQNPRHRFKNFYIFPDAASYPGRWRCYSCGASGRLVELVARVAELEFREALKWLSEVESAPAPEPVVRVRYELAGVRKRFRLPEGVDLTPMETWNSVARDYALSRGLTALQASRWGVGVALEGRLAGRIVFPIHDSAGALRSYAARTFVDDETRYLAPHPSESADVSTMLGERFWPMPIKRLERTVVVFEGALSGMAIERALCVAGLFEQVELAGLQGSDVEDPRRPARLATFGRVVSAADPDAAGDGVSRDLAAALGRRVPFSRLEYPRRGVDAGDEDPAALASALSRHLRGS